jgi:hypothetical protein
MRTDKTLPRFLNAWLFDWVIYFYLLTWLKYQNLSLYIIFIKVKAATQINFEIHSKDKNSYN